VKVAVDIAFAILIGIAAIAGVLLGAMEADTGFPDVEVIDSSTQAISGYGASPDSAPYVQWVKISCLASIDESAPTSALETVSDECRRTLALYFNEGFTLIRMATDFEAGPYRLAVDHYLRRAVP
jgi:hypothetical protein